MEHFFFSAAPRGGRFGVPPGVPRGHSGSPGHLRLYRLFPLPYQIVRFTLHLAVLPISGGLLRNAFERLPLSPPCHNVQALAPDGIQQRNDFILPHANGLH